MVWKAEDNATRYGIGERPVASRRCEDGERLEQHTVSINRKVALKLYPDLEWAAGADSHPALIAAAANLGNLFLVLDDSTRRDQACSTVGDTGCVPNPQRECLREGGEMGLG